MYQRLITCFGLLLIVSSLFVRATEPVHDVSVKIRIADFKDAKAGAVSYTFDDGLRNQYLIAAPIMEKLQIPGTFFVIPGQVSATLQELRPRSRVHGEVLPGRRYVHWRLKVLKSVIMGTVIRIW